VGRPRLPTLACLCRPSLGAAPLDQDRRAGPRPPRPHLRPAPYPTAAPAPIPAAHHGWSVGLPMYAPFLARRTSTTS
jgi:hypothetical protein